MKVIEGWQCVEHGYSARDLYGGGRKTWFLPRRTSKVTSIELSNCELDKSMISTLLGACEALGSFTLSAHSFRRDEECLVYDEICRALQWSQASLRQFRLDTVDYGFVEDYLAPLPSFNKFPKLTRLNLELNFLLGNKPARAPRLVDVLPTCIASLTLRHLQNERWDREIVAPHLWKLVQCSTDTFHAWIRSN